MSTRSGRVRQSVIDASPPRIGKKGSPSQSPSRRRKNSPSRRSPSRRSPGRKPTSNYPVRKSPSRSVKENNEENITTTAPKSPAKRPAIKKLEAKVQDMSSTIETYRSTRSRRLEYSNNIPETVKKPEKNSDLPPLVNANLNGFGNEASISDLHNLRSRRTVETITPRRTSTTSEIADPQDVRRSISRTVSESASRSLEDYSDHENPEVVLERRYESVSRNLSTPIPNLRLPQVTHNLEFGGRIGSALLIFIIPLVVFYILASCITGCSYDIQKLKLLYQDLSKLFDTEAAMIVCAQFILQAILLLLPVTGTKEINKQGQRVRFNGLFASICSIIILSLLDYKVVLDSDNLLNKTIQMAFISYIIAFTLSIILYVKSTKVDDSDLNPYGYSKYAIYNFFIGREIQPTIKQLNVKMWTSRVANITALTLSVLVFKRGIQFQELKDLALEDIYELPSKILLKPTILIYSLMQITYCLYFLIKEYKITSTFYWQSEGMGYLQTVCSAFYPYYFITMSKCVAIVELSLPTNILIAASMLFILGFSVMLVSNNIKYEFRKNSLHPRLAHLESMPTFHGKKLLLSNVWGIVRHPNYLGDIMIHVALAMPGIYSGQYIAAAPAYLTISALIHRAWRDHSRCKRRYGAAWQRYCLKVPSMVIPKVF